MITMEKSIEDLVGTGVISNAEKIHKMDLLYLSY